MAHFKPILTLAIEHLFFSDGRCTNLVFTTTPATRRVLQQYQLAVKAEDTGIAIFADQECSVAFDSEALLRFEVFAQDPYFSFYTLETQNKKLPLYYSSKNITADNSSLVLLDEQPAESHDTRLVRTKPGDRTPLLIVDMHCSAENYSALTGLIR